MSGAALDTALPHALDAMGGGTHRVPLIRVDCWDRPRPGNVLAAGCPRLAGGTEPPERRRSGIGFFDSGGVPVLDKQPEPAFREEDFTHAAKHAESSAFVAHVRRATAGGRTALNTHPFAMHGRVMAHNGGFGELARLDEYLGPYASLVAGDTDSERYFALITQQADAHGGDVGARIAAAARWIAANLPVSALNTIVAAPGELWSLRYPGLHGLHILERPARPG
jgi:predicted glutamine amidotransferase